MHKNGRVKNDLIQEENWPKKQKKRDHLNEEISAKIDNYIKMK